MKFEDKNEVTRMMGNKKIKKEEIERPINKKDQKNTF